MLTRFQKGRNNWPWLPGQSKFITYFGRKVLTNGPNYKTIFRQNKLLFCKNLDQYPCLKSNHESSSKDCTICEGIHVIHVFFEGLTGKCDKFQRRVIFHPISPNTLAVHTRSGQNGVKHVCVIKLVCPWDFTALRIPSNTLPNQLMFALDSAKSQKWPLEKNWKAILS